MKTAKQEAIEKAYGEHWDIVGKHVDEDGYLHHPKGGEVTFEPFIGFMDEHPTKDAYRPKSLSGIETNNGWISILSEDDLPKPNLNYDIVEDGHIYYDVWFTGEMWIKDPNTFNPTHWRESDRTIPIY